MKSKRILPALLAVTAITLSSCGKKTESAPEAAASTSTEAPSAAASTGTVGGVPLVVEFPPEQIEGTPKPVNLPNLVGPPSEAPKFMVPEGTVLLSAGKPVTSSDANPIIGGLDYITDKDKEAAEGYFVELLEGLQWVQIDLEKSDALHAIYLWHYHLQKVAYNDVIVQVSDDPEFKTGVTTLFNNDYDNSAGMGKGADHPYVETRFGKLVDAKGTKARYVRLYSAGNTSTEMNHYIEVEVYGKPQ